MRTALTSALLATCLTSWGQWDVPVRIVLDGEEPEHRQVTGLAAPTQLDAAVSLGTARSNAMNFAHASGTSTLVAELSPAPATYVQGMTVTLVSDSINLAEATLELNGLGAVPLVRPNGEAVLEGDLRPGEPFRAVYHNGQFQVLSTITRPCPPAYSPVGRDHCIADTSQAAVTFYEANIACHEQGARLCTIGEWIWACQRKADFFDSVLNFEWVDHSSNSNDHAKRMGYGSDGQFPEPGAGCNYGGTTSHTNTNRFRCCANR